MKSINKIKELKTNNSTDRNVSTATILNESSILILLIIE